MRPVVYSSLGQRAISQLLFGNMFGSPGYKAAELLGYFVSQTIPIFWNIFIYSLYVFFNIREYENKIFRIQIIIGSHTSISTFIWYQVLQSSIVSSLRRGTCNLEGIPP